MTATEFDVRMTISFSSPVPGSLIYDVFQEIATAKNGFMVQRHTLDEKTTYTLGISSDNTAEEALLAIEGGKKLDTEMGSTYSHLEIVHHLWHSGRASSHTGTYSETVKALKDLRNELRLKILAAMGPRK